MQGQYAPQQPIQGQYQLMPGQPMQGQPMYHPPQPAYNPGQGMAVVGQQFVVQQPITLVLKERYSYSKDDFKVVDQYQRLWFKLDAKTFSFSAERTLLDANGQPVLKMKRAMFSMANKWECFGMNGQMLFSIEPKILSLKPYVNVFLGDGDRQADFKIKGSWMQKDYEFFDLRGGKRLIATSSKQSKFASMEAFFKSMAHLDTYFLTLQPGADAALIVTVCLVID
ncbi:tubby C-terminal-like domain-containing protein, partial [Gorgonomyces haynaldii]